MPVIGYSADMIAYLLSAFWLMIGGIAVLLGLVVLIAEAGWYSIPALAFIALAGFWALIRVNRETAR